MEKLDGFEAIRLLYARDALVPSLSPSQQTLVKEILGGCVEVAAMRFTRIGVRIPGCDTMQSTISVGDAVERMASSAALSDCMAGPLYVGERYIPEGLALYRVAE